MAVAGSTSQNTQPSRVTVSPISHEIGSGKIGAASGVARFVFGRVEAHVEATHGSTRQKNAVATALRNEDPQHSWQDAANGNGGVAISE
jgi:hypothetical protein